MSDSGFSDVQGAPAESGSSEELTAGGMIRVAREAAGLHVAALAVSMKIPVKKLEALEADRLDLLHDAVFVRALAASVCRALKIDPAPVLSKLPMNKAPQLNNDERGINTPFQSQGGGSGLSVMAMLSNPYALLVVAIVAAAIVIKFVPGIHLPEWPAEDTAQSTKAADATEQPVVEHAAPDVVNDSAQPNSPATSAPIAATPAPDAPVPQVSAPSPVVTAVSAPLAQVASAKEPAVTASKPQAAASRPATTAAASKPATVASAAASQAMAAASRPASAPALPSTGMVVFKAKGPTWVKVTDAKGIVQLSKMLANGDVVGASGIAPLAVVIGRADVTEVEVHGKAFPLTTTSKENVARFEVK